VTAIVGAVKHRGWSMTMVFCEVVSTAVWAYTMLVASACLVVAVVLTAVSV